MSYSTPAHATDRRTRWIVWTTLVVVVPAVVVVLWAALLDAAATPFDIPSHAPGSTALPYSPAIADGGRTDDHPPPEAGVPAIPLLEPPTAVPGGGSVFDDHDPGVANLDPALRSALRRAATDALAQGVVIHLNSGWRSAEHQEQLRREAVSEHGSDEAARWVATAEASAHVTGDAVDVGHDDARAWLSDQGASYGLCQVYDNEPWHFELRPDAPEQGCPPTYADPTQDPRMQP